MATESPLGCPEQAHTSSSYQSKFPDSQTHILHFHPVLQLLVSHAIVSICCLTLLGSVAKSTAVPCLGWLWCKQGGTVKKESCDCPSSEVLSWGHGPWGQYLSSPLLLPSGFWRRVGVGSLQLHQCDSSAQAQRGFPGPREALMVAGAPSLLSP